MPIYEYRCEQCGFQKDHLQKMGDATLTVCPSCNSNRYVKQVTAAGFQLKGNGWYATDFKCPAVGNGKPGNASEAAPPPCAGGCGCHSS
jgi:putative FmdB family regulatory protein